MFPILAHVGAEHDWRPIAVASLVCFLASLAAISLLYRALATNGRTRAIWIITAGATTGCGIWSTHFIAMLAYDPGVGTTYDLVLMVISLLAAVVITGSGLSVAVYFSSRLGAA